MDQLFLLDWSEIWTVLIKLVLAFVLVLPVAWNRERETRLMGLRTFPIVAMASCCYILMTTGFAAGDEQAQARVVQGLITGMGFIGGGAILKGDGGVRGTATAASLWATGAIGAAVAYGRMEIAVIMALVLVVVLRTMTEVKGKLDGANGPEAGADG